MDTVLVIAWLVFAHLVADFVLQNDWIAMNKGRGGRLGLMALGAHGAHVALCLVPAVFVFGWPGVAYLVVVAGLHMVVDRWKVRATRAAEARAQGAARARFEATGELVSTGVGNAWSPWPGLLFLADQVLHLTIAIVAWFVLLASAAVLPAFTSFMDAILQDADRDMVHVVALGGVVAASLFLVNTRGAYYFLLALASPRNLKAATPSDPPPASTGGPAPGAPTGPDAMVFATSSAAERLVMVCAVLVGAVVVVALVVAIEVVARFRLLADRGYADWWLLATTGSIGVAVVSGLLGAAALATLAP